MIGRITALLLSLSSPIPFPISLSSILPDGGIISHLRVTISRVYPLVYMMKTSDGKLTMYNCYLSNCLFFYSTFFVTGKKVFHGERYYRRISEGGTVRLNDFWRK